MTFIVYVMLFMHMYLPVGAFYVHTIQATNVHENAGLLESHPDVFVHVGMIKVEAVLAHTALLSVA